ncbi:hypothetical protein [Anabaena sp. UHCC 0451]|uniref:hypothetical protein n=1 Tax=Anabaena sp. UHCC 0451 TaxID=2055235 RepID=UPI002B21AF05|nr:hypothetical protein [Anabaena sp. UHCC 0451]MEA5575930.1 hypothetical protein [Anabaena sp. UHCC 0451]
MGKAKRRKQLNSNHGNPKGFQLQPTNKNVTPVVKQTGFLEVEDSEESSFYDSRPELLTYINELKAVKMTLQQFRDKFADQMDIIEIEPNVIIQSWEMNYQGKGLAVSYRGYSGPPELFPFPDAENPDAPIPPDVCDYLASFWI